MDLISTLAGQLGIDPNQAQAVAGAVLGQAQSQADPGTTAALTNAVPELDTWKAAATDSLPGATGLDDVLGALGGEGGAGGLMGGLSQLAGSGAGQALIGQMAGKEAAQQAQLVSMLGQLGISADKAMLAVPTVLSFLEERLGKGTLDQLLSAAPMLAAFAGGEAPAAPSSAGGIGGMLGSMFGND